MENVKIIHPSDGSVAEVPSESLPHHYRAGWRLLTSEEDAALAEARMAVPAPMTKAQAAKAAAKAAKAESEE